jgi:hypothetical protein
LIDQCRRAQFCGARPAKSGGAKAFAEDPGAPQQAMMDVIACCNFTTFEDVRRQDGPHKPASHRWFVLRKMISLVRGQ